MQRKNTVDERSHNWKCAASGSRSVTTGGNGAEGADHVDPLRNCPRVQVFDGQFGLCLTVGQWSCKGPFAEVAKGALTGGQGRGAPILWAELACWGWRMFLLLQSGEGSRNGRK